MGKAQKVECRDYETGPVAILESEEQLIISPRPDISVDLLG